MGQVTFSLVPDKWLENKFGEPYYYHINSYTSDIHKGMYIKK